MRQCPYRLVTSSRLVLLLLTSVRLLTRADQWLLHTERIIQCCVFTLSVLVHALQVLARHLIESL